MKKNQYIVPSMRVKAVTLRIMAGSIHDEPGGDEQFSKHLDVTEEDGNGDFNSHDIWED